MDLWAFSRADLASLLGVDERQIARLLKSGALDPTDLASIATYWRSHL